MNRKAYRTANPKAANSDLWIIRITPPITLAHIVSVYTVDERSTFFNKKNLKFENIVLKKVLYDEIDEKVYEFVDL